MSLNPSYNQGMNNQIQNANNQSLNQGLMGIGIGNALGGNNYAVTSGNGNFWSVESKPAIHCDTGPAIQYEDGSCAFYVHGKLLSEPDAHIAKQIISGEFPFLDLPLLINHPTLKYFALRKLGDNGT